VEPKNEKSLLQRNHPSLSIGATHHSPHTTHHSPLVGRDPRNAVNEPPTKRLPFTCCVRKGPQLRGAPRIRPTFPTVSSLHEMEEYLSYLLNIYPDTSLAGCAHFCLTIPTLPYSLDKPGQNYSILHDFYNVQKVSSRSWIQFSSRSVALSLTETLPEAFKLEENETNRFRIDWVKS
jgi:hypothetical protein